MEFFDRTKAIIFSPKKEWNVIEVENESHTKVFFNHLLILALIPMVTVFVGLWISQEPTNQFKDGIFTALRQFVMIVGGAYLTAAIIYGFSEQFGATKNFNRAFSLVAYSYTPLGVAGLLYFYIPVIWLIPFLGLYGYYLLFLGIEPQLKPAAEKRALCFIFSLIVMIGVWALISIGLSEIIKSIIYV